VSLKEIVRVGAASKRAQKGEAPALQEELAFPECRRATHRGGRVMPL
jgi:hypothetical protein